MEVITLPDPPVGGRAAPNAATKNEGRLFSRVSESELCHLQVQAKKQKAKQPLLRRDIKTVTKRAC